MIPARDAAAERRSLLTSELARWLPLLIAHEKPEKIILFGSYPRGSVSVWSDVDMVIVKETGAPFLERIVQVIDLLEPWVGLDVLVYTPAELATLGRERAFVRDEVLRKGQVIYERLPGIVGATCGRPFAVCRG